MYLKERLSFWNIKAKNVADNWISFALYWIMFDAYLAEKSQHNIEKKKLDWFVENNDNNELKLIMIDYWKVEADHGFLVNLKNM
ncbi:MAG: hypothetical protein WCO55_01760 [Candidatus Falkowbacteria bacterium]